MVEVLSILIQSIIILSTAKINCTPPGMSGKNVGIHRVPLLSRQYNMETSSLLQVRKSCLILIICLTFTRLYFYAGFNAVVWIRSQVKCACSSTLEIGMTLLSIIIRVQSRCNSISYWIITEPVFKVGCFGSTHAPILMEEAVHNAPVICMALKPTHSM